MKYYLFLHVYGNNQHVCRPGNFCLCYLFEEVAALLRDLPLLPKYPYLLSRIP